MESQLATLEQALKAAQKEENAVENTFQQGQAAATKPRLDNSYPPTVPAPLLAHSPTETRQPQLTKTISVASGKGGVGKSTFVINLAATLATFKRTMRILVLDADWGMANIPIYLNETPPFTIADVLTGRKKLTEIIHRTRYGFDLISGGNGIQTLLELTPYEQKIVQTELAALELATNYDFLLVDCGAGGSELVQAWLGAADEAIILTQNNPAALTDAYSLIKASWQHGHNTSENTSEKTRISLLINGCTSMPAGLAAAKRMLHSVAKHLQLHMDLLGIIQYEKALFHANHQQGIFSLENPYSPVAVALRKITLRLLDHAVHASVSNANGKLPLASALAAQRKPQGKGLRNFFKHLLSSHRLPKSS